jgi:hypothetical protein
LPNLDLTFEYIRNNPLVYKNDNTTLYASNWYNLGHYLKDNAQEIFTQIDFKPLHKLRVTAWYSLAQKGPDYPYIRANDPVTGIPQVLGKQFLESVEWEQEEFGLRATYQVINDFFIFLEAEKRNTDRNYERYSSPYYYGATTTVSFGMNFGFY